MLAEMLDKLHEWFTEAKRTEVLEQFSDARRVCVMKADGKPEWIARPFPMREHEASTLASFVAATKSLDGWQVWVSPSKVVSLIDIDHGPWERITLPLSLSPIFGTLDKIAATTFDQKRLIDLLRIQFAGADVNPSTFELAIRQVKFETTDEQTGDLTPNKADAMGRSIRAQIHAAGDLPDSIELTFLPYPSLDIHESVKVALAVSVDLKARTFQLIPLPGELNTAKAAAVESVRAMLVKELPEINVFCGVP